MTIKLKFMQELNYTMPIVPNLCKNVYWS